MISMWTSWFQPLQSIPVLLHVLLGSGAGSIPKSFNLFSDPRLLFQPVLLVLTFTLMAGPIIPFLLSVFMSLGVPRCHPAVSSSQLPAPMGDSKDCVPAYGSRAKYSSYLHEVSKGKARLMADLLVREISAETINR